MSTRSRRRLAALAAAAALLPLGGCRGAGEPGNEVFAGAPIVVISIDTLRSDRLPAYGYRGVATPAIDAVRAESILFERAYTHVPLTLPAHASLFSGRLPTVHGVRDNSGYRYDATKVPHLPALLRDAGYRTGGAVSSFVLRAETGIAAGFDHYEANIDVRPTETLGNSQRPGRETVALALEWAKGVAAEPFFLFVHLYEPHTPYAPEEPFASRYADPYDGEVATADARVGDLVAGLRALGVWDRAVVVLTSDHGEGLRDHGEQEHGIFLYREAIQVPLLLKLPAGRRGGTTVAAPAQLVDVAPTLLALAGLPPPAATDGTSLLALDPAAPRDLYAETYYPRLHLGWSELTSLVRGSWHYVHGPAPELFDLVTDPAEKTDLLAQQRRTYAELRDRLAALTVPLQAPAEEDPETAKRLAALGYLGGGAIAEGPLPDPKSQIGSLDELGRALHHLSRNEHAVAVPLLERLAAANPRMLDAWENLGHSLHKLGRHQEAIAALEEAMRVSGGSSHVALGLAAVLLRVERLDEAEAHARLGLDNSPAVAHDLLARVALARGDLATAEAEAKAALEARGSRVGPLLTMAAILQGRGELERALALADQAAGELASGQRFPGVGLLRGDLLARLGREAEAEQAFRREIADFPADPQAYSRLAVLYAAQGRPAESVATLRALVEGSRSPAAFAAAVETLRILGEERGAEALLRRGRELHPQSPELRALAG